MRPWAALPAALRAGRALDLGRAHRRRLVRGGPVVRDLRSGARAVRAPAVAYQLLKARSKQLSCIDAGNHVDMQKCTIRNKNSNALEETEETL